MTDRFSCIVCGHPQLKEIEKFHALPRVTSDCKPFPAGGRLFVCGDCGSIQKRADALWLGEIGKIYDEYEIYKLSDGAEQLIFTDLGIVPRSERLVDFLKSAATLPECGRLIDIGCGNGAALARFSNALPEWQLYGNELSDRALPRLRSMPNFVELYTVPIDEIGGRFDLVSMIHSLEHMPSPRSALENAKGLLAEDGVLFVEVPDVETSPFDLLVADHLAHFSRDTLRYLVAQVGVPASFISNSVLPKEITLLARVAPIEIAAPAGQTGMQMAQASILWLEQLLALARDIARTQRFGIFGTSIAGMWLFGALCDKVSFFVDEDPSRIGREYGGKPVLSPLDAPGGAIVFIPLAPATAVKVAERYAHAPARFVPSPAFVDMSVAQ
jgi:SAM-dependent methyltransferase